MHYENRIKLKIISELEQAAKMTVYTINGQTISSRSVSRKQGNSEHIIQANKTIPGVYILNIKTKDQTISRKVMM